MLPLNVSAQRKLRRINRTILNCEILETRITPSAGNFYYSGDHPPDILEYDPNGNLVKTIQLPAAAEVDFLRDMTVDPDGNLHAYTNQFPASLVTRDAKTNQWTSRDFPGWSTVNSTHVGGVAALGQYVFVTDMSTGDTGGEPNGIVRFDRYNNYAAERFLNGNEYIENVAGFDGLLYAVRGYGPTNQIDVIDPVTMDLLRTVTLQVDYGVASVSVNDQGHFFVGSDGSPTLYHLSPAGEVISSLSTAGINGFIDIALSNDHKILASIADPAGGVDMIQSDESLASYTFFQFFPPNPAGSAFITFVDPQIPPDRSVTTHFTSFDPTSTQPFSGQVATFTSIHPDAGAANFTATIDWGDSTQSPATSIAQDGRTFIVMASHTYSQAGPHQVVVNVIPDSGKSNSDTGSIVVRDGIPPSVSITQKPNPLTNNSTATFEFSGSDDVTLPNDLKFRASLDGAGFVLVTNPIEFTDLLSGSHTIEVEAIDGAGNTSAPVTYTWTVDLLVPDVVLLQHIPALTNSSSATFVFTGSDNVTPANKLTFRTSLDGAAFTLSTNPVTYTDLLAGTHVFRVEAIDQAGNVSEARSWNWTIDQSPPTVQLTQVPASLTSLTAATFAFAGTDDITSASQLDFRGKLDGAAFSAAASPQTLTNLAAGVHTFTVEVFDEAGNVSTPVTFTWMIDRQAPTISILTQPQPLTNETTAVFNFAGSDNISTADKLVFEVSLDGSSFVAVVGPASFPGLGAGSHTFRVQARDEAGNTSVPATYTWTLDLAAPTASISHGPSLVTTATTAEFRFVGADSLTPANQLNFLVSLNGAAFAPATSPLTISDLASGQQIFQVIAVDKAGNSSAPVSYNWIVDLESPVVSVSTKPELLTNSRIATFTIIGTDNATPATALVYKARLDSASFEPVNSLVIYSGLSSGSHTFELIATDQVGNQSVTFSYTWTVDATAPKVTLSQVPLFSSTNSSSTLSFLSSDNATPAEQLILELSLDGDPLSSTSSPVEFRNLAVGSHTFVVRATDLAGNTSLPTSYTWQVLTPAPSQLQFTTATYSVSNLAGNVVIPVVRTGSNAEKVTVHFTTTDGTAHAGRDYQATSGVLTFEPGVLTQTIVVPIVSTGASADAKFTITLSDSTQGATLLSSGSAVVTINPAAATEALPKNLLDAAKALTHSDEAFGIFIKQAYELYLDRFADQEGLDYWTKQMQGGVSDEALEANFLGSDEYIQNHGGTGAAWVAGMYEDLLGRKPDVGGLSHWTKKLEGGANPTAIALGFAASGERQALRIGADYEIYLGRSLDEAGQKYWVKRFLAGVRNEDVVAGFVGSSEYWSNLTKGQQNRQTWIRSAFQDILHRAPTNSDLEFWTQFLGS